MLVLFDQPVGEIMRARLRIGARVLLLGAAVVAGWLAARSKAEPNTPETGREIRLPPSTASQPLVSNLEAGKRDLPAAAAQPKASKTRSPEPRPEPRSSATLDQAIAVAPQVVPAPHASMSVTGAMETMPTAKEQLPAAVETSAPAANSRDPYHEPLVPWREPTILIRGGMGGVDDKCDLHRRRGAGAAINRLAPPLRGIR